VKKQSLLFLLIIAACFLFAACSDDSGSSEVAADLSSDPVRVTVAGDGIEGGEVSYDLATLLDDEDNIGEYRYSVINNWPTKDFCVGKGVLLSGLLKDLGVDESFQTITFDGEDGYSVTLTREQVLAERYYYPNLQSDDTADAEPVEMIIALAFADNTDDLANLEASGPCLIIGQSDIYEHNNPAFVQNIGNITISDQPAEQWQAATTYPEAGTIYAGDLIKLQHPDFGLVKLYYTLDGSTPTHQSSLYNPSTYQPELNVPISISEDAVIKVLVSGYGKADSEIATYQFKIEQ